MTRARSGLLRCFAAVVLIGSPAHADPTGARELRLYLPAFSGEQPLGLNVATVVNLRIWRTLRVPPNTALRNPNFGAGKVAWDVKPLGEPTITRADNAMRFGGYDMVLIGSAERYGDGVIAQTALTVRPLDDRDAKRGAIWRVAAAARTIDLGLPREIFEFGTMVLRPEIVAEYSKPSAVTLCPTKNTACAGEPLGLSFTAGRHEGDWSFVTSQSGAKGWVLLKALGREPNETVEFAGALISYFRGDMDQAEQLFGQAANTAAADSIVQQDATILQAVAKSRRGAAASEDIDRIRANDPYSRYALQVAVMDALQRAAKGGEARDRLKRLANSVREGRDLFTAGDPWLAQAEAMFAALGI
jgi:hypothetical protein